MKATLIKVPSHETQAFILKRECVQHFYLPYHYHQELELTFIQDGTGTRFIGDNIESFSENDLVLVGSNVPHLWRNDNDYYNTSSNKKATAISIQFLENEWGKEFMNLYELKKIKVLFQEASFGIKISGKTLENLKSKLLKMLVATDMERFLILLDILNLMAICDQRDKTLLSGTALNNYQNQQDAERLNVIYNFVLKNFKQNITLENVADTANLSRTAFCRYFKSRARKTFLQFLTEIRVEHACKLLRESRMPILSIAYESGFNNISNFNKHFRNITGLTPLLYQREHIRKH